MESNGLLKSMNTLCRSCMTVIENYTSENYVVFNNEFTKLSEMLEYVTSLKILKNDGLPTILCNKCVEQVNLSYTFKHRFSEVNYKLQKLAGKEKSSLIDGTITNIKKENEFYCEVCQISFHSYYALSMHTIIHNRNKSLFTRFESTIVDVKNVIDLKSSINEYNSFLISERKACNSELDLSNEQWNGSLDREVATKLSRKMGHYTIFKKKFIALNEVSNSIYKPLIKEECNKINITSCTLCDKTFANNSLLSLHFLKHAMTSESIMNINVDLEFFFCEICGQTFENDVSLTAHYNTIHQHIPSWTCEDCNEVFDKEVNLLRHDALIHSTELYRDEILENDILFCILCYERFASKVDLLKHSFTHLMKKYYCRKCSLSFCTQNSYFSHLQLHSGSKHICDICGKYLSSKNALKLHVRGVHSNELSYTCSTCGKSFSTSARLKTHSLIHSDHKKHVCFYCGYSTHKVGDLRMHIRTHTSERPYKCTFVNCSMSFKTSSHLCGHIRRHLQIRKFKCENCPLSFTTGHSLKIHQMQHTGEKPHCCIVCNRKFRRKYHVKIHMKQHIPPS